MEDYTAEREISREEDGDAGDTHDGRVAASRASLSLRRGRPVDASRRCDLWAPVVDARDWKAGGLPSGGWWSGMGASEAAAIERERRLAAASDWLIFSRKKEQGDSRDISRLIKSF